MLPTRYNFFLEYILSIYQIKDTTPNYPGVNLKTLQNDDAATIRPFFNIGSCKSIQADDGYLGMIMRLMVSVR